MGHPAEDGAPAHRLPTASSCRELKSDGAAAVAEHPYKVIPIFRRESRNADMELDHESQPNNRPCARRALPGWPATAGQTPALSSSQTKPFMGTWVVAMTNPQGASETVSVWDQNGVVAASLRSGRFPAINATGIFMDGKMLVLTLTRFENGRPIRAVVALTVKGGTINMAQMLEFSETIKRGSGTKEAK